MLYILYYIIVYTIHWLSYCDRVKGLWWPKFWEIPRLMKGSTSFSSTFMGSVALGLPAFLWDFLDYVSKRYSQNLCFTMAGDWGVQLWDLLTLINIWPISIALNMCSLIHAKVGHDVQAITLSACCSQRHNIHIDYSSNFTQIFEVLLKVCPTNK